MLQKYRNLIDTMGRSLERFYDLFESPIGPLWIVAGQEGLSFLLWNRTHSELLSEIKLKVGRLPIRDPKIVSPWHTRLRRYFSGERVLFDRKIAFPDGSPFQQRVWRKLLEIPYGEVRSYQSISNRLKIKGAARAVGNACGKNPLPIVVPCHRVIRQDGSLGGYTGGLHIKNRLLKIEGVL